MFAAIGLIMKYDAVVVGENFAAYAAAAMICRRGISCALVTEPDAAGGRSRITGSDGFTFDYGVLSDRFAGLHPEKVLKTLGIPVRFHEVGRTMYFNGSKPVPLPESAGGAMASPMLGLKGKAAWARLFRSLKQQTADPYKYKKSVADWLLNVSSADQDLTEYISLRAAAALDVTALERIAVGTFIDAMKETGGRSQVVPLGGWECVFKELENVILGGGDIISGAGFEGIAVGDGCVRGVRAGGELIEADFVAAALPVRRLLEKIPEEIIAENWRRPLKNIEPAFGLILHLGLDRPVTSERGAIITMDPFTRGMAVSNIEPSLAPRGCQLLTWFIPAPESALRNAEELKNLRLRIKEILELLFPNIMEHVISERWSALDPVGSALPVIEQTKEELPPAQVFEAAGIMMLNDAVNAGGGKGEPALRAAFEAASAAGKRLKKQ